MSEKAPRQNWGQESSPQQHEDIYNGTNEHAQAFLRDIAEHPEDDTPRLIYADWLAEQGEDDRGDLIRVQCALAKMEDDNPRKKELEDKERQLLKGAQNRWEAAHLRNKYGATVVKIERGIPNEIQITPQNLVKNSKEIFREAPTIRGVDIGLTSADDYTAFNRRATRISKIPQLEQLEKIGIVDTIPGDSENQLNGQRIRTLLESPNLKNVKELEITGIRGSGRAIMDGIVGAKFRKKLESLRLERAGIHEIDVQEGFVPVSYPQLKRMSLSNQPFREGVGQGEENDITGIAAVAFVYESRAKNMPNLEEVDLRGNYFEEGEEAVRMLLYSGENFRFRHSNTNWIQGRSQEEETENLLGEHEEEYDGINDPFWEDGGL